MEKMANVVRERLYVLGKVARAERTRKAYAAIYEFYDLVERAVNGDELTEEDKRDIMCDALSGFERAAFDLVD